MPPRRPHEPTWVPPGPDESGPVDSGPTRAEPTESGPVDSGPVESGPGTSQRGAVTLPGEPEPDGDAPSRGIADEARYLRDGLLGRGGMGVVYLARDRRLDRAVALKEAARGGEIARRLAREAKVTAGLDHPGIVTVHDAGVTLDGRPFYTMRLLRGRPLSTVLAEAPDAAARLALLRHFLDACNALAYAHAEGMVHRDVKPANIMIGRYGETQVVDWGLATPVGGALPASATSSSPDASGGPGAPGGALGAGPPTATRETRTGAALGTPAYMSPEQARGAPADPRADVWSLGAVLYELLTGQRPRSGTTGDEVVARAREGEVPSLVGVDAPPELITIAQRALAADPAERYPDAGALAADVAAFVDGRRVEAHRYTPWELLTRLVRAWRAPLTVAAVAAVLVIGLVAAGTWRLARERDRVVAAELDTRRALATSDTNLAQALVTEARTALSTGSTAVAAVLARRAIVLSDAPEAWGVIAATEVEARAERLEVTPIPPCRSVQLYGAHDLVCAGPTSVSRVVDGTARWTWSGLAEWTRAEPDTVFVGRSGRAIALDAATGEVRAGDWAGLGPWGRQTWPVRPQEWGLPADGLLGKRIMDPLCPGGDYQMAVLDLGRRAYASVCEDGRVGVGEVGGPPHRWWPTPASYAAFAAVSSLTMSPDGRQLVIAGTKGDIAVVDLLTGATVRDTTADRDAAQLLALSADGTRLAVAGDRGDVEVRELPGLTRLVRVAEPVVSDARFLPDGTLLVAGAGTLSRWRLPPAATPHTIEAGHGLTAAVFAPDGRRLATAHGRGDAALWELPTGRRLASLALGNTTAKHVTWSVDGSAAWFATTGAGTGEWRPVALRVDGRPAPAFSRTSILAAWPALGQAPSPAMQTRRILSLRTGELVALTFLAGAPVLLDPSHDRATPLEGCPPIEWFDVGQAPGGERAVLVGAGDEVVTVTPGVPTRCTEARVVPGAIAVDVDADGTHVVVGTADAVVVLDAQGAERWRVAHPGRLLDVSVSADGRWVAAGFGDHTARVWEGATGRLRAVLPGHRERVSGVDFRPDGAMIATASWDGTARLWDLSVLGRPAADLDASATPTWGLTLAEALDAAGR